MTEASRLLRDDEDSSSLSSAALEIETENSSSNISSSDVSPPLPHDCETEQVLSCSSVPSFAQCVSVTFLLASIGFLVHEIFLAAKNEGSSSTFFASAAVHPALVWLALGLSWHLVLLLQGLRIAVPSLAQAPHAVCFYADSHPYAHQAVQLVVQHDQDTSRILQEKAVRGTQVCIAALILFWVPCALFVVGTTTSSLSKIPLYRILLTAASLALLMVWTLRFATHKAARCRLDTLNTAVYPTLTRLALFTDAMVWDLVQVLRWMWHSWVEDTCPSVPTVTFFRILRGAATATVYLVAMIFLLFHLYNTRGLGLASLLTAIGCLLLYSVAQGIPQATALLSPRAQEAALSDRMRQQLVNYDPQWPLTLGLVMLGALVAQVSLSHDVTVSQAWLVLAATMVVTAVTSLILSALARDFAVAFLTTAPVPGLVAVTTTLTPWLLAETEGFGCCCCCCCSCHHHVTSYQPDVVYLGTVQERRAWTVEKGTRGPTEDDDDDDTFPDEDEDYDIEATGPVPSRRIASYPAPTANPNVILEEHEF